MPPTSPQWTVWHTLGLFAIIVVAIILAVTVKDPKFIVWTWVVYMLLFLVFSLIAGFGITGMFRGLFIDSQNTMSLSRLQMVLWTILILSAYLAAVVSNIHRGQADPLGITLPHELWALMGISTTSLIGSPLIKSIKKDKPENTGEKDTTLALIEKQGEDSNKVEPEGQLIRKKDIKDASWSDLFRGEEVGNWAQLDLGKVQMFYFTLVVFAVYAVSLGSHFLGIEGKIDQFLPVNSSMLVLLGISHAGYLTNKAIPHSKPEGQ